MIKLSKKDIFNNEFISTHIENVKEFVSHKKSGLKFFNHSFSADEMSSGELIECIAFDPFMRKGLHVNNESFLSDYHELSKFLLYGHNYLDIIKKDFAVKSGSEYKKKLMDERTYVIDKFKNNNILKTLGIGNANILKNEVNYLQFNANVKKEFKKQNSSIESIFNYSDYLRFKKNIRNDTLDNINIIICPYCNRQFIDTYSHEGKIKSLAQIDHFFPKSTYPLYALSLLNLIPSCSYCNCIIKRDKLFPWEKIYVDEPLDSKYFDITFRSIDGIYGEINDFDLKITPNSKSEAHNAKFFRHQEIYNGHKHEVSCLLKKRLLFTKGYKKSIEEILSNEVTESEFKFLIFGVTGSPDDHLKIPLSKLKNDILKY